MFRLLSRGSAVVGRRSIVIDVQQHIANAVPDPPARRPQRSEEEKEKLKAALGKVTFLSSYEFESLRAPRSNAAGELFSQQKLRIENREHFIHELQSIVAKSTSEVDAWDRIDSAAEHASAKLENDLDDKQKVREFSDWNMIYIAPDTHREIIRHNDIPDLPPATQAEFYRIKENWFPEEYRSTQGIDIQLAAAFSPELRKRFSEEVTRIGKQAEAEVKTDAERKLIQQEIANSLDAIDPTRDITDAAIAAANLDELRVFAERVQAYNGDERLLAIYTRAAKLQGVDRSKFLSTMKEALYSSKLSPLGEPKSSSWDPAWDPAKGNEAAPQIQAAH